MSRFSSPERESLILRLIWMVLFFFVWQLAELLLLGVVLVQLVLRLVKGRVNEDLLGFGDSLGQYLAQIARFGTFNSEQKPWPLSDWPAARPADVERVEPAVAPPAEPRPEGERP